MAKEKVYIVLSHIRSLKPHTKDEWNVTERVEFVNQLRQRHITMSSAIGDYLNKKLISGIKLNMTTYAEFDNYIRMKYAKQMGELDRVYGEAPSVQESAPIVAEADGSLHVEGE